MKRSVHHIYVAKRFRDEKRPHFNWKAKSWDKLRFACQIRFERFLKRCKSHIQLIFLTFNNNNNNNNGDETVFQSVGERRGQQPSRASVCVGPMERRNVPKEMLPRGRDRGKEVTVGDRKQKGHDSLTGGETRPCHYRVCVPTQTKKGPSQRWSARNRHAHAYWQMIQPHFTRADCFMSDW